MITYRTLCVEEITRNLFAYFQRRQEVTKCFRKEDEQWVVKDIAFIDDWTEEDYGVLITCLQNTVRTGGVVFGAFLDGKLKGFASLEPELIGSRKQYTDLSSIHVSQEMRGKGIGRVLFRLARKHALKKGAEKLYISAHSAVESQAFYRAMGCVEAEEYNKEHVEQEPCDCQLECQLKEVQL